MAPAGAALSAAQIDRLAAIGEGAMAVQYVHARLRALRITPAKAVNHE